MDRLEQLDAARQLAEQTVTSSGTDGDAKRAFYEAAVARFPHLSASEIVKLWNEAAGIDSRTGLPVT